MRRRWAVLFVLACAPALLAQSQAQTPDSSRALEALAAPIYQQLAALRDYEAQSYGRKTVLDRLNRALR